MTRDELLSIITFLDGLRGSALTGLGLHAPDPYWNLTLYLMRRHLEAKPVTVTSLASAALIPYASAMRRIDEMIEAGLIFKRPRSAMERSFSVHPTEALIDRFEASMKRVKLLVARTFGRNADDDTDGNFYFGGSYMGVRVVASPSPLKPPIGRSKPIRILVQDDPTFQVLGRFRRELQEWLGGPLEIVTMSIDGVREETLANARRPNSAYDIVAVDMPWIGEYAAENVLRPLTAHLDHGRINSSDFQPAGWQGATHGTIQYGIPIQTMPELLFCRSDLLAAAGRPMPESTAELLDAARALANPAEDRYGIAWCGKRGTPIGHTFMQFMAAFGGPPLKLPGENGEFHLPEIQGADLSPAFDTPVAEAAAEFMMQLREVSPPDIGAMAWEESVSAYASGRVGMAYCWSCRAARFELDPHSPARGTTAYLPHPHGPDAPTVVPMGGYYIGIPANLSEARVDLAWRVIEWLVSPEAMKLYVQNGSFVSPRFSVSADPEVAQGCRVITAVDRFAKQGQLKLWPRPPVAGIAGMITVLGEEVHDMVLRRQSPRSALARAQARAEKALACTRTTLAALRAEAAQKSEMSK